MGLCQKYKIEYIDYLLNEGILNLKKTKKSNKIKYDLYLNEVNSSINVCEIENLISKEQADYLRIKYLEAKQWDYQILLICQKIKNHM